MSEKQHKKPYLPVNWGSKTINNRPLLARAAAIQALMLGQASPDQQKLALQGIVEDICGTYDMTYSPDSQHDTAFAEGKRWVGLQIVKLQSINLDSYASDD